MRRPARQRLGSVCAVALSVIAVTIAGCPPSVAMPTMPAPASPVTAVTAVVTKKAKPVRITAIRTRGRVPSGVVFSVRKPALKGGTETNRLTFLFNVEDAITDELRAQARAKKACSKRQTPRRLKLTGDFTAGVIDGRWASAALVFTGSWCRGATYTSVRSFTLDLTTNRPATLAALTPLSKSDVLWAAIPDLYTSEAYAARKLGPTGTTLVAPPQATSKALGWTRVPAFTHWVATRDGIQIYIPVGRTFVPALAPWHDVGSTPTTVAGHAIRYAPYASAPCGVVARIPTELAPAHLTPAAMAWISPDGGTSAQVQLRPTSSANLSAMVDGELAEIAAGGVITDASLDGTTLNVTGHEAANPDALFAVRVRYGPASTTRVIYRYPAAAAPWATAWATETMTTLRTAPLDRACAG
ncbi:MAG: hypothetical protein LBK59_00340 [Bifidobacteriaceae bacterium]|jgi:hypothetical protein|nr:hypothetical protein [Bifidobacteriaceae bacterium]